MLGREPAIIAASVAAVLQGIYIFVTQDSGATLAGLELWLVPVVTFLAGLFTRQKVMPVKDIKDAGLDPETIHHKAEIVNHQRKYNGSAK